MNTQQILIEVHKLYRKTDKYGTGIWRYIKEIQGHENMQSPTCIAFSKATGARCGALNPWCSARTRKDVLAALDKAIVMVERK